MRVYLESHGASRSGWKNATAFTALTKKSHLNQMKKRLNVNSLATPKRKDTLLGPDLSSKSRIHLSKSKY